jgi:OmpA-OmpF porin, OOP family
MLKKRMLALAALAMGMLSIAQAEEYLDDRWYVAPFGTFIKSGGDRGSHDGWGGGMGFGKILNEHFNVEAKGFYQGFGGDTGRWDLTGGSADLQYFFSRDTFAPYTVVGLGAMNTSHGGGSGTGFIGEIGAGFTYELHDNFLIRSDVRYRYNNNFNAKLQPGTEEFHDMTVNVGFVVPFGPKPMPAVAQVEPPPPAPVVADCSTLDDDSDGVNNCDDRCPNSMSGIQVSKYGCWIVDVKFDNDKAIIKEQYYPNLDNVAEAIKNHPDVMIEVQGHTSKTGGFKHNMELSERRAKAVKDYLLRGNGITNVTSRGYGWTHPIDTNDTEEGRANNRRVQLEVDGKPQAAQ